MATWQFDFHLVPRAFVSDSAQRVLQGGIIEVDFSQWWRNEDRSSFSEALSKLLPPMRSWSSNIEIWGSDDGDRIDLTFDASYIESIFVRVDVRQLRYEFLVRLLELCRAKDILLVIENGTILEPRMSDLIAAILVGR